jgi:hypothetical protein
MTMKYQVRHVLIDESTDKPNATPYDTEQEATAALRKRIAECLADPEHYLEASYVEDCTDKTNLDDVSDDEIEELLSEIWINAEGETGVWSNFSSADRWSVSGQHPEDEPFGNADTRYYRTAGLPSGEPVNGVS